MSRRLRDEAWRRIRDGLNVSGSAKVLLLAIAEHCDGELKAFEDTIAEWVGMSARSVRRLRRELIDAGCLVQTVRSAPKQQPRFVVLPEKETPASVWPTNTGQRMADDDGSHPLRHRPGIDEQRPASARTPANPDRQNQKEPEEPAAALPDYLAIAIEEAKQTDAHRRANGGKPIENLNAWAEVRAKDPTFRARVNFERQAATDDSIRATAISKCDRCDSLGFVDLNENTRAKCPHPDLVKEQTR